MNPVTDNQTVQDQVKVAAFYQFVPLDDIEGLQREIRMVCENSSILGTILLANEGINGTIAGSEGELDTLFILKSVPGSGGLEQKGFLL